VMLFPFISRFNKTKAVMLLFSLWQFSQLASQLGAVNTPSAAISVHQLPNPAPIEQYTSYASRATLCVWQCVGGLKNRTRSLAFTNIRHPEVEHEASRYMRFITYWLYTHSRKFV
jgi:hypothetical protein